MRLWRGRGRQAEPAASAGSVEWLLVGLGNPGPRYAATRHNLGRRVIERLAERMAIPLDSSRGNARYGLGRLGERRVCLAIPLTYMNESGQAVGPLARFFKVPPERVLVAYDELDLPLGQLRLRPEGGPGGHRGMRSLIQAMGTSAFPRLRLGIGRPPAAWDPADYVLAAFAPDELPVVEGLLDEGVEALDFAVREGLEAAMNRFNRRAETA